MGRGGRRRQSDDDAAPEVQRHVGWATRINRALIPGAFFAVGAVIGLPGLSLLARQVLSVAESSITFSMAVFNGDERTELIEQLGAYFDANGIETGEWWLDEATGKLMVEMDEIAQQQLAAAAGEIGGTEFVDSLVADAVGGGTGDAVLDAVDAAFTM